jgi:hypothetical protein
LARVIASQFANATRAYLNGIEGKHMSDAAKQEIKAALGKYLRKILADYVSSINLLTRQRLWLTWLVYTRYLSVTK